jgi:CBS domain-containing protein
MSPAKQLRSAAPFDQLPDAIVQELLSSAKTRVYPPGNSIFEQDDPPTGFLYIVKKGLVEITAITPSGIDLVVEYRREKEFFGEMPIFSDETYSGGARAAQETECYLIPAPILRRAEEKYPQLRDYFTGAVLSRVRQMYGEIVADHTRNALSHLDGYPFQKRLSEVMSSPVETCGADESIRQVAQRMVEKNISSVLVLDAAGRPVGLITERDLVARVIAEGREDGRTVTAAQVMTGHPYAMAPDAYMYEAMAYMLGHRLKHLPVVDGGVPVGMVTLRDLMRYRSQKAMLLLGNLREEKTLAGLALIRQEIVEVARTLLSEVRSLPEVMEIISYIHHEIIKRVYDLRTRNGGGGLSQTRNPSLFPDHGQRRPERDAAQSRPGQRLYLRRPGRRAAGQGRGLFRPLFRKVGRGPGRGRLSPLRRQGDGQQSRLARPVVRLAGPRQGMGQ